MIVVHLKIVVNRSANLTVISIGISIKIANTLLNGSDYLNKHKDSYCNGNAAYELVVFV